MAIEARPIPGDATVDASLLLDQLPTMSWTATPDGRVDYVNELCCTFTGLPREQLLGAGVAPAMHPEDLAQRADMKAQLAAGHPFEREYRLRRHDGQYIRCLARAVPIRNRAGHFVKWLGTITIVEDARRAEDRWIRNEHLQLALDSADVGIWRLELPSCTLTVDERTRRHLDFESNVILDYRPQDFIHPDDFAASIRETPGPISRFETEHRVRQRDGTYRWQAIHWRRWVLGEGDDERLLVTGTSMDVTSRKQHEAEREELWQRYRIALSAAELGTWSCDLQTGEVRLDDRARSQLESEQALLSFRECLACIHEQDRQRTLKKVLRRVRHPSEKYRGGIEFRLPLASGEVRWLSMQLQVNAPAEGRRATRIIGVIRDSTKYKQAEEKVRRLNVDLERRVQQRTAELTAANEELESFAYAVSHDLRAPLRAMWGFSDAILEDYGPSLEPQARQYLQHVIDGSRHLGEIIDGLLTLSRSTRGELRRDAVDLSEVATKVLRNLALVDPERKVSWTVEPNLSTHGDARMIDVVMNNLLGNAWKYSAHRTDAHVRVYSERDGDELYFCVADNGAGFNMEHAEKLFQPFQRLHRQDEFGGLGIGLATVQRIVHRHGGKVSGTGVPGQGALFRFNLAAPEKTMNTNRGAVLG